MKKALSMLVLILMSQAAQGLSDENASKNYNQLFTQQELLHHVYKGRYLELTDINKREALHTWYRLFTQNKHHKMVYSDTMSRIDGIILGKDYRQLLYYFTVTGQAKKASQTLGLYLLSAHTLLKNFTQDPQNQKWNNELSLKISSSISNFDLEAIEDVEKCYFQKVKSSSKAFSIELSGKLAVALQDCVFYRNEVQFLSRIVKKLFLEHRYYGAPFPISFSGYVGGNSVQVFNNMPMERKDVTNLGRQLNLALTKESSLVLKRYSDMSVKDFQSLMYSPESAVNDIFTSQEGFLDSDSHRSFRHGIYAEVIKSIRSAKESVFIDMFWMGGSVGINLAKELIKKINSDPDFSVYIITDSENKFNYGRELDFVYNYMRAFSEKFVDKNFYIVPANIGIKRTALPEFFDLLITDEAVNSAHKNKEIKALLEKDGFHLLAKSDHTKVFVIDGKNPELSTAYVGSKNWTDSSGGLNFDEVVKINGPAAPLILNSFYYDTTEALLKDHKDGNSLVLNHLQAKYPNIRWQTESKILKGIQLLLIGMDVIDRHSFNEFSPFELDIPYVKIGNTTIAPSQNNIYGTEMSPLEQNIQAILGAKKQIIIDDQFLYDPMVIEALKVAKLKNHVDIYILLESLKPIGVKSNTGAHIPNNLFVNELTKIGIPIKWKVASPDLAQNILNEQKKYMSEDGKVSLVNLSATFHVKSITVDGISEEDATSCNAFPFLDNKFTPILITGSANKDVMTMSGGFREYQVAVYDPTAVMQHDCIFWSRWNDPSQAILTNGLDDFELPESVQSLGITDKETFLNTLRSIIFTPYNFTKDYFN